MISYVIPTRNRAGELAVTLEAIGALGDHAAVGGAEVIIVDNASDEPVAVMPRLASGVAVRVLRSGVNLGAAARNDAAAVADARSSWLVMLDDDSAPTSAGLFAALRGAAADVGAIAAEVFVPAAGDGVVRHEAGGLPEVFVGCGVALRRELFAELGGYDATFDYYAEEYDLSAKIMMAGHRVVMDRRFRVMHRKVLAGRQFSRIVQRLARNNAWVAQRYAPGEHLAWTLHHTLERYEQIARKESAMAGYEAGLQDLRRTLVTQARTPMTRAQWDRFTGLSHARGAVAAAQRARAFTSAALVHEGKNSWAVTQALSECGVSIVEASRAEVQVVGTMSPGPMMDAVSELSVSQTHQRVIVPWLEIGRWMADEWHRIGSTRLAAPASRN